MAADAEKAGDADEGDAVQRGRRDDRQPADPGREGRREPEDDGARVDAGGRSGQGRGAAEQPRSCSRRSPRSRSCWPARAGEDAGGDELGDGRSSTRRVGEDVPTLNEVEEKIQARYAKAQGRRRARPRRRSSRGCSRSSRPRPTSRRRAACSELRAELGLDTATRRRPPRSRAAPPPPEYVAASRSSSTTSGRNEARPRSNVASRVRRRDSAAEAQVGVGHLDGARSRRASVRSIVRQVVGPELCADRSPTRARACRSHALPTRPGPGIARASPGWTAWWRNVWSSRATVRARWWCS